MHEKRAQEDVAALIAAKEQATAELLKQIERLIKTL